jgi:hypothetical protein
MRRIDTLMAEAYKEKRREWQTHTREHARAKKPKLEQMDHGFGQFHGIRKYSCPEEALAAQRRQQRDWMRAHYKRRQR